MGEPVKKSHLKQDAGLEAAVDQATVCTENLIRVDDVVESLELAK
jgi:hypothetical protein